MPALSVLATRLPGTLGFSRLSALARRAGLAFAAVLALAAPAAAQLEIDVTEGTIQPIPIAIPGFTGAASELTVGQQIAEVVANDLRRSGLFRPLDPATFLEGNVGPNAVPGFASWRALNAQALVAGGVTREVDGSLRVDFRLWDVFSGQQLDGQQFFAGADNWRRVAHIVADAVYERLTGEGGYFDTRVVFIDETGPREARVKRLAIMDQDGANVRYLTQGADLVLTPRFSPNSQELTYMAFDAGNPRVYLLDLETGQQQLVGNFPGMTFSPRFSPDGERVIMSLQSGGNSSIYTLDLRSGATTRLTDAAAIDTSPSYSPDGQQIVFESDRNGRQQIFVMNADGSNPQRISFGDGSYSTPVWSPRGDLIAFTKQIGGQFAIGVMSPTGSDERLLTVTSQVQEGPTWAPNGRVLMFFRDSGGSGGPQLFSIDLNGRNEQLVPTPNYASDPAWSPLLN